MVFGKITEQIIAGAIRVHTALGPGLLESAYESCLAYELVKSGFQIEKQKQLPLVYGNARLDCSYRLDLLVQKQVVVEIKSVDCLLPIHQAQLLSYFKLPKCSVGLLINFNVSHLRDGIRRIINT